MRAPTRLLLLGSTGCCSRLPTAPPGECSLAGGEPPARRRRPGGHPALESAFAGAASAGDAAGVAATYLPTPG